MSYFAISLFMRLLSIIVVRLLFPLSSCGKIRKAKSQSLLHTRNSCILLVKKSKDQQEYHTLLCLPHPSTQSLQIQGTNLSNDQLQH